MVECLLPKQDVVGSIPITRSNVVVNMKNLKYFDCNSIVGPRPHKHPKERWSTTHLLEDMKLAEISGALVTHSSAIH